MLNINKEENYARIEVAGQIFKILKGDTKHVDINKDAKYDISIKLEAISYYGLIDLVISKYSKKLDSEISEDTDGVEEEEKVIIPLQFPKLKEKIVDLSWMLVLALVIIGIAFTYYITSRKK